MHTSLSPFIQLYVFNYGLYHIQDFPTFQIYGELSYGFDYGDKCVFFTSEQLFIQHLLLKVLSIAVSLPYMVNYILVVLDINMDLMCSILMGKFVYLTGLKSMGITAVFELYFLIINVFYVNTCAQVFRASCYGGACARVPNYGLAALLLLAGGLLLVGRSWREMCSRVQF